MERDRVLEHIAGRMAVRRAQRERAEALEPGADQIEMRGGDGDERHPVEAPAEAPTHLEALHSIAHRMNDIAVNMAHARNHLLKMMEAVHAGRKMDVLFNADHAQKHMLEMESTAEKVAALIEGHPVLRKEWERLQRDNVMNQIIDPHNHGPKPPSGY